MGSALLEPDVQVAVYSSRGVESAGQLVQVSLGGPDTGRATPAAGSGGSEGFSIIIVGGAATATYGPGLAPDADEIGAL